MGALRPANGRNDSVKLPLALIALSSCLMAQNAPPVLSGSGSIIFPSSTPGVTANSLYDTAGTLKWAGNTVITSAGGTLTGDLLVSGTVNIGSGTNWVNQGYFYGLAINNALSFDYGAAVRTVLIQDGSGNLRLRNNLSQDLWTWSDAGLATSYSSIVPSATNSWVLGTYGLQWANIYTQGVCLSNICLTQWPALFNTQTSGGSLNVTYGPNPGPVPLFMTVSAATGSVSNIQCLVNGSVVAQFGITGTNLGTCSFFVPVGATYEISAGTGAILSLWTIWN